MGDEGHAIGVVEPNTTVRAEDTLGEFMQIRFEGVRAWVRYKGMVKTIDSKSSTFVTVLVPSQQNIPNFYKNLEMYSTPVYYRFNDELPLASEIKVRLKPDIKAEVVGHVTENMQVEAWAILDDCWLQIRFNEHETAWVIYKNKVGDVMLLLLHDSVQAKLRADSAVTAKSPFKLRIDAPELQIQKKKRHQHFDPEAGEDPTELDAHTVE